jgi:hypothetical protein
MRRFFHLSLGLATVLGGCIIVCTCTAVAQTNSARPLPKPQKQLPKSQESQPANSAPVPSAPPQPLSLLQEPAKRARVQVNSDELFVEAENANLSQILKDIASATGMKLDGLEQDGRVFGNYGPGPAREVLSQLLEGTGYNVLMVGGTTKSVPRELVLTPRNSSHATSMASSTPIAKPEEDEDTPEPDEEAPQATPPAQRPDMQAPASASPNGQQSPNGVKTPQELLEELRKIRGQNQNQNQNQQQSPQTQPPPQ